jgi:hypothetical protein
LNRVRTDQIIMESNQELFLPSLVQISHIVSKKTFFNDFFFINMPYFGNQKKCTLVEKNSGKYVKELLIIPLAIIFFSCVWF